MELFNEESVIAEPKRIQKILVIDDDYFLMDSLTMTLECQGYDVAEAYSIQAGIEASKQYDPDLILLDVMLPDGMGNDFIRELKNICNPEIIILSGVVNESKLLDIVVEQGADDYLQKPVPAHTLLAKVHSRLRDKRKYDELLEKRDNTKYRNEKARINISINEFTGITYINGYTIALTLTESKILNILYSYAGEFVQKEIIIKSVWGENRGFNDDNLKTVISRIKKKIEECLPDTEIIECKYNCGYKLKLR